MPRTKKTTTTKKSANYLERIEAEVSSNQSRLSLILGILIVLVVGVLVFNYFNKNNSQVGPAQQTEETQGDVSPENLPGKYTVKEGDTLFLIAEKYYTDGNKFTELVKANNLTDENSITVGQVLDIPKLEGVAVSPTPSESPMVSPSPSPSPDIISPESKGGTSVGSFGPAITGDKYTVQEGDWLSTIAARAYSGDVMAYQKLAAANNISNPDLILPGQVITIPR